MLQRIQSLFLLGTAIIMALSSVFPLFYGANLTTELVFKMGKLILISEGVIIDAIPFYYSLGLSVFCTLLSLFIIFQYGSRKMQMRLSVVNLILMACFLVLTYLMVPNFASGMETNIEGRFTMAYFSGILAILFNSLARVFIKKDDDLVRSVDRLR